MADEFVLSSNEKNRFAILESIIAKGKQTFIEVGNALLEIRDNRLYREDFATFEDYCRQQWGMGRNYTNKLIAAIKVVGNLGTTVPITITESQIRPLTKLEPEQQREAWSIASRISSSPTAAQIEEVAKTIERAITQAIEDTRESEPIRIKTNGQKRLPADTRWIEFFGAVGQLLRIDPFDSENILNRYVELHDDLQTVSQDLDQCRAAINRIQKIKEELLRRFPNV